MSVDRNLYLGPYVECVYKTATRTEQREGCSNGSCRAYGRKPNTSFGQPPPAFCPTCGSAVRAVPVEVPDRPPIYEVARRLRRASGVYDEQPAPSCIGVADRSLPGIPGAIDVNVEDAVDLRDRDAAVEISAFEKTFAAELTRLREAYASVEIKWGLVTWFS